VMYAMAATHKRLTQRLQAEDLGLAGLGRLGSRPSAILAGPEVLRAGHFLSWSLKWNSDLPISIGRLSSAKQPLETCFVSRSLLQSTIPR
jgi:hypothetical protein